jgi:predicted DNA-binding transcriptional regulator AlpA
MKVPLTCKQFAKVYGLYNIKPFPKKLKLGLDYIKEEVLELFGLLTNKYGYICNFNNNPKFGEAH